MPQMVVRMPQMVVRGAKFWYDRDEHGYGNFVTPYNEKPQDQPALLETIAAWLSTMGKAGLPVKNIATAGTYVAKSGMHGKGLAVDIDAIELTDGRKMVTRAEWEKPTELYIRTWAALLLHFPQVLSGWYNAEHRDHFHCDLGGNGIMGGDRTVSLFVQVALRWSGFEPGAIDGVIGSATQAAFRNWWAWALNEKLVTELAPPVTRAAMGNSLAHIVVYGRQQAAQVSAVETESDEAWNWVKANKLMDGTDPDKPVTRKMLAVILKRYASHV